MNLQNDNLYKKVEGMLYSYTKTKAEIENIKIGCSFYEIIFISA